MGCGCGKKKLPNNTKQVTKTATPKSSGGGTRRTRRIIRRTPK